MVDNISREDRIKTMRAVKSSRTSPERRIRAMLAGYKIKGWRINPGDIIGKPDFAFPLSKIALFIDGCFWHKCPVCNRPLPTSNGDYWERKIQKNVIRDREHNIALRQEGWHVIRIWEHEIKKRKDFESTSRRIYELISNLTSKSHTQR